MITLLTLIFIQTAVRERSSYHLSTVMAKGAPHAPHTKVNDPHFLTVFIGRLCTTKLSSEHSVYQGAPHTHRTQGQMITLLTLIFIEQLLRATKLSSGQ
jgi:hypothetical protein